MPGRGEAPRHAAGIYQQRATGGLWAGRARGADRWSAPLFHGFSRVARPRAFLFIQLTSCANCLRPLALSICEHAGPIFHESYAYAKFGLTHPYPYTFMAALGHRWLARHSWTPKNAGAGRRSRRIVRLVSKIRFIKGDRSPSHIHSPQRETSHKEALWQTKQITKSRQRR